MAKGTCSIGDCDREVRCRGYCKRHYQSMLKYGGLARRRSWSGLTLEERFRLQYKPCEHGCWKWQGTHPNGNYGSIQVGTKTKLAHRVSYELFIGPIPEGLEIDHVVARGCVHNDCVNPAHLEAVTHEENMRRRKAAKTHCIHGHEYTPENTGIHPKGSKFCLICRRETDRRARERDRERKRNALAGPL